MLSHQPHIRSDHFRFRHRRTRNIRQFAHAQAVLSPRRQRSPFAFAASDAAAAATSAFAAGRRLVASIAAVAAAKAPAEPTAASTAIAIAVGRRRLMVVVPHAAQFAEHTDVTAQQHCHQQHANDDGDLQQLADLVLGHCVRVPFGAKSGLDLRNACGTTIHWKVHESSNCFVNRASLKLCRPEFRVQIESLRTQAHIFNLHTQLGTKSPEIIRNNLRWWPLSFASVGARIKTEKNANARNRTKLARQLRRKLPPHVRSS